MVDGVADLGPVVITIDTNLILMMTYSRLHC